MYSSSPRGELESGHCILARVRHTWAILEYQPHKGFSHDDLVQAGDVGMYELSVVVDFASEVRVVLVGRFEDNLRKNVSCFHLYRTQDRGARLALDPFVSLCVAR